MIQIDLSPIPNQQVTVQIGEEVYTLALKETRGVMSIDLMRGDVTLAQGLRIVAGTPVVPYGYLIDGNFVLLTEGDEYPDYMAFGVTQSLFYLTNDEIAALTP